MITTILGLILVALPFVAAFFFPIYSQGWKEGWKDSLIIFGIAGAISACVFGGVFLLNL